MKPFIISVTQPLSGFKATDTKVILEYFKKEFKRKANPDNMTIRKNLLLIENDLPWVRSLQLIAGIDRLEIICHKEGMIEYRIYLIGFHIIASVICIVASIFLGIYAGIFLSLIFYVINYSLVVKSHKKFINQKIEQLNQISGSNP